MRRVRKTLLLILLFLVGDLSLHAAHLFVVVTGLGGMPEYDENFQGWAQGLQALLATREEAQVHLLDGRQVRKGEILARIQSLGSALRAEDEFWLFLIGHGNFDGRHYKFAVSGPDLTDEDLRRALDGLPTCSQFVVAATSSAGLLVQRLRGANRVILAATRSETERQPPRFLSFFIEGARSAEADANRDGRVSLWEAYSFSRHRVESWYKEQNRIQTEHPVLDDQGQVRLGVEGEETPVSPAGLLSARAYLSQPPRRAYRTLEAEELGRRVTQLERQIEDLKFRKSEMETSEYYRQLEELLVELATLNQRIKELEEPQ